MTNVELAELLKEGGYDIDSSTISNYKTGRRKVSPAFIHHVSICLDLNQDQVNALLQAYVFDILIAFLKEFNEVAQREL